MRKLLTILLVDDHAVVRTGYKTLIQQHNPLAEILEANSGEQACQIFNTRQPDLIIMDLSLGGMGGLATIKRVRSRHSLARILVFSIHDEPAYVTRAMQAGARGYISKSCAPEIMLEAVTCILNGGTYLEPRLQHYADTKKRKDNPDQLSQLSQREFDVFCMIARGMTSSDISAAMHLSSKTIANYKTSIKQKLEVKTLADLTRLAIQHGLIEESLTLFDQGKSV